MRFYKQQHPFYCGIDLHAKTMYVCIVNQAGEILVHRDIKTRPDAFLRLIEPYREGLVVGVECMFSWYWLSDLCDTQQIDFVLGHALYMKAIHGGKTKNDKIDSEKIAMMLRGGMMPIAYVYPKPMRATRDLLRRRTYLVRTRKRRVVAAGPVADPERCVGVAGIRRAEKRTCARLGQDAHDPVAAAGTPLPTGNHQDIMRWR